MKILVTGGAGYIGSHFVQLAGDLHSLTTLDNLSTGFRDSVLKGDFIEMDLANFEAVENYLMEQKFDAIVHFAAKIVVPESVSDPIKYYMNNTVNTTNLIKAAIKSKVKYFIFSSTAAVYGNVSNEPVNPGMQLSPQSPYGWSKAMSERVILDASAAHPEFKAVILRYFNVAGAALNGKIGQRFPNATHLIKVSCEVATGKREKVMVFGDDYPTPDGTGVRDYIHVEDLANAHIAALDYLAKGGKTDVFNCGYGKGFSVNEVIDSVRKVANHAVPSVITPRRAGDVATVIANNAKILNTLDWKPKNNDLELICKTAYEWEKKL